MITDYVADGGTREAAMASRLANPNSNLDTVTFHTDFEFITVLDELTLSSASFSSQNMDSRTWDSSSGCC